MHAPARHRVPEIMDDPALDPRRHHAALVGLARLNRLARVHRPFLRTLAPAARERPLQLLDIATGGGDLPLTLARWARRVGVEMHVSACDISPRAIEYARQRARRTGLDVHWFVADTRRSIPPGPWDAVTCSLFLHHLDEDDAASLLASMAKGARLALISDLRRCLWGSALARTVPPLTTTSPVVHDDAVRSARAAFTIEELRSMTARAGMAGARIEPVWPARLFVHWEAPR